jgi:phage terminase large subunit
MTNLTPMTPQIRRIKLRARANKAQAALANSKAKFPALVGGFGSGKTHGLILRAMKLKIAYPQNDVGYYLPTYDLVKKIGYPRFQEQLQNAGMRYVLNKSDHQIWIENFGNIIFRTLDNPDRIVGYEVGDSLVDELDTLKPEDAAYAWRQIIARNRQKKPNGDMNTVGVGTTPEGFRFVYERWKKNPRPNYELIKAKTIDNVRHLPEDYIDSIREAYPAHLLDAYLDGEFVNLVSGGVYPEFDRALNYTDEVSREGDTLHVGMDFNVNKMSAVVHKIKTHPTKKKEQVFAVKEFFGVRDTPTMIKLLQDTYPNNTLYIYPDATGRAHKSVDASVSDIKLLKGAFMVKVGFNNPRIRDRLLAVNGMICNIENDRNYFVNVDECPNLTECLEQQVYDKHGEPDKTKDLDHLPDATGYFMANKFPVSKPATETTQQSMVM